MDVDLPKRDLRAWVHHLPSYFGALNDRFLSDVQRDTPLREIIAAQGDDVELSLVRIENGAQVLRIVQHFMRLALGDSSPAVAAACPFTSQSNTEPGRGQQLFGHPIYSLVPLNDSSSQIRLVKLLPGNDDDPIAVNLLVAERGCNQYAALSYVWGSRNADVSITVSGEQFDVSANLAEALRCLRHKDVPRAMWIDAICINQFDDAEKSAQVAMMGDIYRNAADVLIFLGGEKDDSDLVMKYLELEGETDGPDGIGAPGTPTVDVEGGEMVQDTEDYRAKRVLGRIQRCGLEPARFFGAADAFFKRPWWTRVWTVQEFALASQEHLWCCGRRSISSPRLRGELRCLSDFLAKEALPATGSYSSEIMMDSQIGAEGQFTTLAKTQFSIAMLLKPRTEQWEALPLMSTLTRFQFRQSTDRRDYIYALREMLSPIAKHVFIPDYSIPADELFVRSSSYLLLSEDRIDGIYATFALLRSPSMPSWALDFARPLPLLAQGHHLSVLRNNSPPCNLSRRPAVLGRALRISGVTLDTLDTIMSLEDASSDMEKLGLLWKAQGFLWHHQPSEAMPEAAKTWIPGTCLLPLDAATPGRSLATSPLTWPITPMLPGFSSFCLGLVKATASASLGPRFRPENLTCQKWKDARRLSPFGSKLFSTANVPLIRSTGDPETFYAGACFDYDNLKAKILGIKYREDANPEPRASFGGETEPVDQKSVEEKPVEEEKTAPVNEGYIPQYGHITSLLREAASEPELKTLQAYLLAVEDSCHETFDGTALDLCSTDPVALEAMPGIWQQQRRDTVSSYHEILESCSCPEGERNDHQRVLKALIDNEEDAIARLQPRWDQASAELAGSIPANSRRPSSKVFQIWNRDLSSIFTTRWGFSGFTFQRQACLRKGDVLAVLDGMPAPVVLEEIAHSGRYRLKALVQVHGIEGVAIDKLTELGLCIRRDFEIV